MGGGLGWVGRESHVKTLMSRSNPAAARDALSWLVHLAAPPQRAVGPTNQHQHRLGDSSRHEPSHVIREHITRTMCKCNKKSDGTKLPSLPNKIACAPRRRSSPYSSHRKNPPLTTAHEMSDATRATCAERKKRQRGQEHTSTAKKDQLICTANRTFCCLEQHLQ